MIRVGLAMNVSYLGGVNYARNLVTALSTLEEPQIEPVLLLGNRADSGVLEGLPPVEVIRSPWFDQFSPRWAVRKMSQQVVARDPILQRVLLQHRIQVLSHYDFLGRRSPIPTICWIADFQHLQLPNMFKLSERKYRDRNLRLQGRLADRIILSSEDSQLTLATFQPSAVGKSRVLHFVAVPDAQAATNLASLQDRYGFHGTYFHVPNQFWAHKNHRLIIDALAIAREHQRSFTVLATGATQDRRQPAFFDELMGYAGALGVTDVFKPLGVVPREDLFGLMANAIALINPSRVEGWSTSVEEAKSLGKRIILSDIAVHREQAPPDGVYIYPDDAPDLADALYRVQTDFDPASEEVRRLRARDALPERVRRFADNYQQIVLEVLSDT